jgi:hypothetical protein
MRKISMTQFGVVSRNYYFWGGHGIGVWIQGFILTKPMLYYLNYNSSPFCCGYFGDGVLQTICLDRPQTIILAILVSQVARITGREPPMPGPWMIFLMKKSRCAKEHIWYNFFSMLKFIYIMHVSLIHS